MAGYTTKPGKISESRIAWTRNMGGLWVIREYPPIYKGEHIGERIGSEIKIQVPTGGFRERGTILSLTNLTEKELVALQELLNNAFSLALAVAKARDKAAKEAADAGDDSHFRVYRSDPDYVVRERGRFLIEEARQGRYDNRTAADITPEQAQKLLEEEAEEGIDDGT